MKNILIQEQTYFLENYTPFPNSTFNEKELEAFAKYNFYPVKDKNGYIMIATPNEELTVTIASDVSILPIFLKYYKTGDPLVIIKEQVYFQVINIIDESNESSVLSSEANALSLFNKILTDASRLGASDIHFIWQEDSVVVKFRVDGEIMPYKDGFFSYEVGKALKNICVNKASENEDEKNEIAGKFTEYVDHQEREYRLSIGPSVLGYNIVLRAESKINKTTRIVDWGYSPRAIEIIEKFKKLPYGIVLVTGPTGSGKSTLLYTIANEIYTDTNLIVKTVEDPVEIQIDGIHQVQVNVKGKEENWMTFSRAIKMFLRQDPDLIIVGEMRDAEVAKAAIAAAKTGHLTFSTLHTNDVKSTISRLFDIGIEVIDIEDGLRGVISQRLIPTLCNSCKIENRQHNKVYYDRNREGCIECRNSKVPGLKGRIPITELALLNGEKDNYYPENFEEYYSMTENILWLLNKGMIDQDTAKRHINYSDNEELARESELLEVWTKISKDKEKSDNILIKKQPIVNSEFLDVEFYETYLSIQLLNTIIRNFKEFDYIAKELDIYNSLILYSIKKIVLEVMRKKDKPHFINVDKEHLLDPHMLDSICKMINDNHMNRYIIIETRYSKDILESLRKLNSYNIKVSLDNFAGDLDTIYEIIQNNIEIAYVKTSKEFIAILREHSELSVLNIAALKLLGVKIIIAYIDSKATFALLQSLNTDNSLFYQGYTIDDLVNEGS
jgi:type II secretory ATPase GspE/PulE/Tfp pilus assembly ATPase PilB-like protein/EAL domain-containing protein (putative c-di-GMP-specific phosphodiesterase class I)